MNRMIRSILLAAPLLSLPLFPASAEKLSPSQFISVMQNNTLTGRDAENHRFHVYFLPGGIVTYENRRGVTDHGTWMLNKNGDVCITWSSLMAGKQNCYAVNVDKNNITFGNEDTTLKGDLLGGVQPLSKD
ncbi:MAG TPA: hypothetical protein VM659_28330 [Dongiaceae bacterium]|nr:hypothetical protein [Dongiaceae bacterium]